MNVSLLFPARFVTMKAEATGKLDINSTAVLVAVPGWDFVILTQELPR